MASHRQRSRKHAQRVQQQHLQRARLRQALETAAGDSLGGGGFSWKEIVKRMEERGYVEGDRPGTWRCLSAVTATVPRKRARRRKR